MILVPHAISWETRIWSHRVKFLLELGLVGPPVSVIESDDILIDEKGDTAGRGDAQQTRSHSFVECKPAFISGQRNKPTPRVESISSLTTINLDNHKSTPFSLDSIINQPNC